MDNPTEYRPLGLNTWRSLKAAVKDAETSTPDAEMLGLLLGQLDGAPRPQVGVRTLPSRATLGYMKRRGRRLMRRLLELEPARYVVAAHRLVVTSTRGHAGLDLDSHWLTIDVLFGRSRLLAQQRHGRSGFLARHGWPPRTIREERAPTAWDARPDLVDDLLGRPDLPWQVHLAAAKMRQPGVAAPQVLNEPTLEAFFSSPSAVLQALAARDVAPRLLGGVSFRGGTVAAALFLGAGNDRHDIEAWLVGHAPASTEWRRAFATRLWELAVGSLHSPGRAHRVKLALAVLDGEFADYISPRALVAQFSSLEPRIRALANRAFKRISEPEAMDLVRDDEETFRRATWEALADAGVEPALIARLWHGLLLDEWGPALSSASASDAAVSLLSPSLLDVEDLIHIYRNRPQAVRSMSQQLFERVIHVLPADAVLAMLLAATDERIAELRTAVRDWLEAGPATFRSAFWRSVWQRLTAGPSVRIEQLVFRDDSMAETFAGLDGHDVSEFLSQTPPAFAPLLLKWASARSDEFLVGDPLLLAIATHPQALAEWGLTRIGQVRLNPQLAVALAVSPRAEAVTMGQHYLGTLAPGSVEARMAFEALCGSDSPAAVPLLLRYLEPAPGSIPPDEVARLTADHHDDRVREIVARLLLTDASPAGGGTTRFASAAILRGAERRRTREAVKQRLTTGGNHLDSADLDVVAASGSAVDAEWAMQELALRAAKGAPSGGLRITGSIEET